MITTGNNRNTTTTTTSIVVSSASAASTRRAVLSMVAWIAFGLFGWYYPRSLIHRETSLRSSPPPYQVAGDAVIVDFELNQPLVDPPTVDSECVRECVRVRVRVRNPMGCDAHGNSVPFVPI